MTYFADFEKASAFVPYNEPKQCFGCGKELLGPIVRYDGYGENGVGQSEYFHRDCAFAVAQRLILDTWPNRREGVPMSVGC
jgi:hypothetical protein